MGFPQSCTGTERAGAEPHGHGAVPLSCVCPTSWCPSYCPVFILLLSACPIVWCPSYCPVSVPLPGVHPTAQCLCHCPWFILLPGVHPTAQCPSHCPRFILLPGVCPRARCLSHSPVSTPLPGVRPRARCLSLCPVSVPPRSWTVSAATGLRSSSRCPVPPAPEREQSQAAGRAPPAAAGNLQLIFHPASRSPTRVTPNACHTRWRHGLTAPARPHSLSRGSCSRLLPRWLNKLSGAQPAPRSSRLKRDANPAVHTRCQ